MVRNFETQRREEGLEVTYVLQDLLLKELKLKERWTPVFFQTVSLYSLCHKSSYLLVSEYP
jgi:hypothetical protein